MDPRRLLPGLLTVAVVCLVTTLGVVALRPLGEGPGDAQAVTGTTPPGSRPVSAGVTPDSPIRMLAAWDQKRARAWAHGDHTALAALYGPGSRTGAADLATLRRWTSRGLRVVGLQTQVLEATVVAHSRRQLRLLVTDRLVGGEAIGRSGHRVRLPSDRASTRVITMEKLAGQWLVGEVRGR